MRTKKGNIVSNEVGFTRKILKLRPIAADFTLCEIGDGSSTFFWLDKWLPIGRLVDTVGPASFYQLGVPKFAKVSEVVNETGWMIPSFIGHGEKANHAYYVENPMKLGIIYFLHALIRSWCGFRL
ncbi:hypothetical protein ISN44_As13g007510 [Arabidopsis suecica]|uniref:Reverse transcriptase zinc-binding domain-containing protein n=1 Tax=Arabidopsis suecica TaxID=45249 RepID=A0A8T1Y0E0_ARASU|nr:hypothetical protein ISN44_As13g007510 [Arabidopsis suecica]